MKRQMIVINNHHVYLTYNAGCGMLAVAPSKVRNKKQGQRKQLSSDVITSEDVNETKKIHSLGNPNRIKNRIWQIYCISR